MSQPDRILAQVRYSLAALLALALANGVFLYFLPSQARTSYAWPIKPAIDAAVLGAGYLAGGVGILLALTRAQRFRQIRALVPGFCALGIALLAATLINNDKFRWGFPPTWLWTVVYVLIAPGAIYLWRLQSAIAPAQAPIRENGRVSSLRGLCLAFGSLLAGIGIALYVAPTGLIDAWGWPMTTLLSRVFGGWYLLAAGTLLFLGRCGRDADEFPIPVLVVASWSVLLLLLPLLYEGSLRTSEGLLWAFIAFHGALLVACAGIAAYGLRLTREEHRVLAGARG